MGDNTQTQNQPKYQDWVYQAGDILKQLLTPNAAANTQAQADTMNQALTPSQEIQKKSAEKGLQSYYDVHVQNTPPEMLANYLDTNGGRSQPVGQNFGGQQPAPIDPNILNVLVAKAQQQQQPLDNGQYTNQQKSDLSNNLLNQTNQAMTPEQHKSLVGNVLNFLGNISGVNAVGAIAEGTGNRLKNQKLENIKLAQEVGGVQQITPEQLQQMDRTTFNNTLNALTDQSKANAAAAGSNQEAQKTELNFRGPVERALSAPSSTGQALRVAGLNYAKNQLDIHGQLIKLLEHGRSKGWLPNLDSNSNNDGGNTNTDNTVGKYKYSK